MPKKIKEKSIYKVEDIHPHKDREGLVYARVSSKKQELEGNGRKSQEERCKSDLISIKVPHTRSFLDTASGFGDFMKRPAMRELLNYIDAHPHKKYVVVFDDLKRFARDTQFHLKLRAALKARDVLPRCLNYKFDDSPEGLFVETILSAGNELERHQNRRQVIQKMKARMDLGYYCFGNKRGYKLTNDPNHGKILVPNKDGIILKEALESFASGRFIQKVDVARFLFEKKFWKSRSPDKYIDQVSALLKDPLHAGFVEYLPWGVDRRPGKHKGIISLETFTRIQQRLNKDLVKIRTRSDISEDFPVRGVVLCSSCLKKLTAAFCKGKYPYYYCVSKGCELRSKMIHKKDIEDDFKSLIERNRIKSDVSELVQLTYDRVWKQEVVAFRKQVEAKEHQKTELEQKIRDLSDMARKARSERLKEAYEGQIEESMAELEKLEGEGQKTDLGVPYRTALNKATGMLKNPLSIWDSVDVHEKHRLFFFLFEKRLEYVKDEGFRTGNSLSTTRLFEEFVASNSDDVDPIGFEPMTSSLQMRRSTN